MILLAVLLSVASLHCTYGAELPRIFLPDNELINALRRAETAQADEMDIFQIETTLMRQRSVGVKPSEDLLTFYSSRLLAKAAEYKTSGKLAQLELAEFWNHCMETLLDLETNTEAAMNMHRYYSYDVHPRLFGWIVGTRHALDSLGILAAALQADEMWTSHWHKALVAGALYLHGEVPVTIRLPSRLPLYPVDLTGAATAEPPGLMNAYRADFVQALYYHRMIYLSFSKLPHNFNQIVEVGGGTASNAVALRNLNFQGTHFILDLEPMLFLQQFFLSYSGWPSYMGDNLGDTNYTGDENYDWSKGRSTILGESVRMLFVLRSYYFFLVVTEHDMNHLARRFRKSDSDHSLFYATYSLTEIPLKARKMILDPSIIQYGYIFIVLAATFDGIDNIQWAHQFASIHIDSYSTLLWTDKSTGQVVFLCLRRHLGAIVCSERLGCTPDTVILAGGNAVSFEI